MDDRNAWQEVPALDNIDQQITLFAGILIKSMTAGTPDVQQQSTFRKQTFVACLEAAMLKRQI